MSRGGRAFEQLPIVRTARSTDVRRGRQMALRNHRRTQFQSAPAAIRLDTVAECAAQSSQAIRRDIFALLLFRGTNVARSNVRRRTVAQLANSSCATIAHYCAF